MARRLKAALETRLGVARAADARRRPDRRPRSARRAREQQQGRAVHQPARQRVAAPHGARRRGLLSQPRPRDGDARRRRARAADAMPVFGGGTRDIEVMLWEMAQARHIEQSAALARRSSVAARVGAHEPARDSAGAVPRARWARTCPPCSSRWATSPTGSRKSSSPATTSRRRRAALADAIVRFRGTRRRRAMPEPAADAPTRVAVILVVASGRRLAALHRPAAAESRRRDASTTRGGARRPRPAADAGRKIKPRRCIT